MIIYTARYLLPISSKPLKNGAVAVEKGGIAAVGPADRLAREYPEAGWEDLGRAVILPGLVNCHAHLELTAMRGFLDDLDSDFLSWLLRLTRVRRDSLNAEDIETSALFGALESVRAGITCVGDIGRHGRAGLLALKQSGLRGILFQETDFSPDNSQAAEDFVRLREKYYGLNDEATDLVGVGISPHAPYTVSDRLFEKITEFALEDGIKLTIHAAESAEEQLLMKRGEGFFAGLYKKEDIDFKVPGMSSIAHLAGIGVLDARPLLAHCVRVSPADIELIAGSGAAVAHCPKSNAKFGHGVAPLAAFLNNKVPVGLGSDSVASNNVCDILEEARFAALLARVRSTDDERSFIGAEEMLGAATIGGARALGLADRIGSLETGKRADLIAISLNEAAQQPVHDIYAALVFSSSARDVILTMTEGRVIYRRGQGVPHIDERRLRERLSEISAKMEREARRP